MSSRASAADRSPTDPALNFRGPILGMKLSPERVAVTQDVSFLPHS